MHADLLAAARAKLERQRRLMRAGHETTERRASLNAIEALVETLEFAVAVKAFWQETYDANADLDIKWGEEPLERQVDAVIARAVERLRAWVEAG